MSAVDIGGCAMCPERWGPYWTDTWIPTDVWVRISPTGDEDGHLCLNCIAKALIDLGLNDVPVALASGPWFSGGPAYEGRHMEGTLQP